VAGANNWCLAFDCSLAPSETAVGFLGGVQIGYNFQSGNFVYGLEADFGLSTAKKTQTTFTGGYNWSTDTGIDAFGTARLRLGYAFDRAMVYGTGGLAYAKVRDSLQGDTGYAWSGTSWRAGWTAGGGVEYAVNRNWSVKGEALYYDLGSQDLVSTGSGAAVGWHDHTTGWVARMGLNYLFH
jgi:outer membrane immunogenic protein